MRRGAALTAVLLCASWLVACGDAHQSGNSSPAGILYGPGPHWIRSVEAGTLTFAADAVVDVDFDGDGRADNQIELSGTTTVTRTDSRPGDPGARDRTHLDLEIISMDMEGAGVRLEAGDGIGNQASDGPLYCQGTSDEVPGSPALALDRFDLFFAVEIGGLRLHNMAPFHVESTIDRLPPIGSEFTLVGPPVLLFTPTGAPSGISITGVSYTPVMLIETDRGARHGEGAQAHGRRPLPN